VADRYGEAVRSRVSERIGGDSFYTIPPQSLYDTGLCRAGERGWAVWSRAVWFVGVAWFIWVEWVRV